MAAAALYLWICDIGSFIEFARTRVMLFQGQVFNQGDAMDVVEQPHQSLEEISLQLALSVQCVSRCDFHWHFHRLVKRPLDCGEATNIQRFFLLTSWIIPQTDKMSPQSDSFGPQIFMLMAFSGFVGAHCEERLWRFANHKISGNFFSTCERQIMWQGSLD